MDPSALVRVCGLEMVCHTTMEAQPDAVLMSPDSQCFGSSGGYALLGSFRVAERAEAYDYAPFYIPAGCIVFSDYDMQVPRKEIRCQALCPQPTWFGSDRLALLTNWRYIPQPEARHGQTAAAAYAFIELLSPPVLLPKTTTLSDIERPLSWWLKRQVYPELELENQFFSDMRQAPPLDCRTAVAILARQRRRGSKLRGENDALPFSVLGRVCAVGSLIPTKRLCDDGFGFLVDVSIDSGLTGDQMAPTTPLMLCGRQFLGLFASLSIGDSLFVSGLLPMALFSEGSDSIPVFVTSPESSAYRIDDFDGLDEASVRLPLLSQQPFTHASQESLLSRIAPNSAATGISGIPYSQLSESPSHSQVNQGGGNRLTQASQSQATASQNPEPDDCHLLVHRDRVESYSGLITRVVDATLGIYLVDNCHILMLAFWPPLSLLPVLRPGTRVLLDSVHVLLMANSKSYHWSWLKRIWPQPLNQSIPADEHRTLVFGACTRSSVRIAAFPDTTTPSPAHLLMAESLAAYVVKQAGGLVQMVEAIEAFWKLQVKFPDGLSAKSVNTLQTTSGVDRSSGEVMDLALRLTGQHRTSAAGKTSGHRRLYIEFLDHTRCTSVDCLDGHPVSRVVALGDIVQRFLSQKSENRGLKPSSAVQAYSKPTHKVRSTQEVRVTNTYPAELSFGAFPLIGRLVLRQRGVLYLQDATGWLQIRPTTVSIPSADSGNPEMVRLQFSGQALVGHIYSWGQWRLTSESISIAPAGNNFNISLGSSTTVTAPFELVYVAAATPTIIYADHSFGRGSSSNATTKCTDTNVVQCFLLVVHTSSPVAIASRSKRRKSGTDNVGGTSPSGTRAWTPYIAVKGAGLKIGYSELHNLVKGGGNGVKRDSVLCVSVGETNELLNCVVSYDPDELPVSLMPGSAYVVCTDDPSAITRFGVSDMDVQIVLKNTCHVHPVWVTLADGSDDGDKPYAGMHHRELLSQASGGGKPLHIPTIRVDSTHSKILGAIWPSPVYPVRELHSLVAGLLRAGPGASEDSRPGDIISVHGTIDRRSIKQAISFTSSSGSAGDVQLGSKRSKASSDSAGPRVLCFDTRIVLRDSRDSDSTITLYTELSSFAHPLGLVPGTRVVVRDVRLEMAKNSGRAYLRGVAATSFQEIATELEPDQLVTEHKQTTEDFESKRVCVGQLYGLRVGKVTFNCTICAVEQLHLSVTCKKCKQAVCGLLCACLGRRHEPAARPAAAVADVELQCRVADGSGTARLLAHDGTALAEALGLSEAEISGLLATAAQSSSGRLLWTPQLEGQDVDTDCVITRAAAASLGTALRVEGMLQREQLPPMNGQRQPLRVGGQAVLFCQQTAPRVAALQIARLSMPALCWQLLADLSESYA